MTPEDVQFFAGIGLVYNPDNFESKVSNSLTEIEAQFSAIQGYCLARGTMLTASGKERLLQHCVDSKVPCSQVFNEFLKLKGTLK